MRAPRARRSELATPASSERMCEKAPSAGADLVFLDLEDACAPAVKESARPIAVGALTGLDWGRTVRAVRVNGIDTPWCHGDIIEIVTGARDALDVLIVPKVRSARDVWWVDVLLGQLEAKLGLTRRIGLEVLIEDAEGLANALEIAQVERPARGAHLRCRRSLGVAARPGRRQLRARRALPGRLLALRPGAGAHRGAGRPGRRHRRALSRVPGPRRLPALGAAGERARASTASGPSTPARSRSPTRSSRRPPRRWPRRGRPWRPTGRRRPAGSGPSGATAGWSTPPTCGWRRTPCTRPIIGGEGRPSSPGRALAGAETPFSSAERRATIARRHRRCDERTG